MAKRCNFCFTKSADGMEQCPICKISYAKTGKEVTKEEKKVWHAARNLYIVSFLLIIGGAIGICVFSIAVFIPTSQGVTLIPLVLSVSVLTLGISLRKFKSWTYIGGIIYFLIIILLNIIKLNILGILIGGIFLYVLANPTAKKILHREI